MKQSTLLRHILHIASENNISSAGLTRFTCGWIEKRIIALHAGGIRQVGYGLAICSSGTGGFSSFFNVSTMLEKEGRCLGSLHEKKQYVTATAATTEEQQI